jgi:hypothetical protein
MRLTKKRINKAITHLNLEIVGNGDGYFYFVDTVTGHQIGHNVLICRLNFAPIERWVSEAEEARKSGIIEGMRPE